ncbi:hypothetical protein BDV97DRAFT_183280 [Delphinella strobiligena]|nr:hypothetical protein BDV97DRAFT_183280 [Delphinella strobiligena]
MRGAMIPPEESSTVRHLPSALKTAPRVRFAHESLGISPEKMSNVDLFSSGDLIPLPKQSPISPAGGVATSSRLTSRPRVSSKTFVRHPGTEIFPTPTTATIYSSPSEAPSYQLPRKPRARRTQRYRRQLSDGKLSSTESVFGNSNGEDGIHKTRISIATQTQDSNKTPVSRNSSGNSAFCAAYMNRTGISGLARTKYSSQVNEDKLKNSPHYNASPSRPPLEPRVSGPMGITISVDGGTSALMSPDRGIPEIALQRIDPRMASSITRSSDRDVWHTITPDDSDDMSPRRRREMVRERLRDSISRPLGTSPVKSEDSDVTVHTYAPPGKDQDTAAILNMPAFRANLQPQIPSLTKLSPMVPGFDLFVDQPVFPAPLFSTPTRQSRHSHAVLGTSDEAMYTATSRIGTDGTFCPASGDIRGFCPRSSSLSPQHRNASSRHKQRRKKKDKAYAKQSSPYERLSKAALNNPAFKPSPKDRRGHVSGFAAAPPPVFEWGPTVNAEKYAHAKSNTHPALRHQPEPKAGIDFSSIIDLYSTSLAANSNTSSDVMAKIKANANATVKTNAHDAINRRHVAARNAAWALLGKKPLPPLPHEKEPNIAEARAGKSGVKRANAQSFDGGNTAKEDEGADAAQQGNSKGDMLLVHPGIGTKDRKFVEVLSTPTVTERREDGKAKDKPERCGNCRILLKSKRELQEEVHTLRGEIVALRRIVDRGGR